MMIKRFVKLITVVLVLMITTGCGILKEDINIIYTSDIHCNMDGDLDYASVKEYKDYIKRQGGYTVLVDGGDFIEGGYLGSKNDGKDVIEIMNKVGYNVVTLGNHEFDYGLDALKECIDLAKFDVLSCNIKYLGEDESPLAKVKPYVIKRYGLVKVAYVGIMTPELLLEREPSYDELYDNGEFLVDVYADANDPGENGDALFEVIQNTIDEAKSKADIVIAISHIGINHTNVINSYELIEYTRGIDIVLDAHAHKEINEIVKNLDGEDVVLFAVGGDLDQIGLLTIKKDGTIETSLTNAVAKDANIENYIQKVLSE